MGSRRHFRFGCEQNYPSIGSILLRAFIQLVGNRLEALALAIDLVDLEAPPLTSRRSLSPARGKIDFEQNHREIRKTMNAALAVSQGGHLLLKLNPRRVPVARTNSPARIFASPSPSVDQNEVDEDRVDGGVCDTEREILAGELLGIQKQIGRASENKLTRAF